MDSKELVTALRTAIVCFEIPNNGVLINKELLSSAADKIEELREAVDEWGQIFDMLNDRENRHRYLDWWRNRYGEDELTYPDGDEIYRDFWNVMDDLRSVCREPNAFQLLLLQDKWGFTENEENKPGS